MITRSRLRSEIQRSGFTIVELMALTLIIAVLAALLLPNVRRSHEAARRMSCLNNLKQIGIALHNYHSTYNRLPSAMAYEPNRLSGLVVLLPYLEQQELWDQIANPLESNGIMFPAMGPGSWISEYPPWRIDIPTYRCPSSSSDGNLGFTDYAFCIGDAARDIHQPTVRRGMFAYGMTSRFRDIRDGLSNTIAMAEIGTPVERMIVGQLAIRQPQRMLEDPSCCSTLRDETDRRLYADAVQLDTEGRGARWADGAAPFGLFNTVLPPNSPSIAIGGTHAVDGLYSAGSFHRGGTHVLMGDGAVTYISEGIDAGDQNSAPLSTQQMSDGLVASPYGLWGALGAAADGEPIPSNTLN